MKYKTVNLPQLLWYENDEVKLRFPSSWEINVCYMKGHRRPPLTRQQLKDTLLNPIGTKPIRKLAKGKKEVVILFDDIARPTRVAEIFPFVLEELKAAGIKDDQIRFIAAVGAHGALTRLDFARKLGEVVLSRFPVYNHNPYENCTFAGNTKLGTPVSVNSEVMNCDLKIGIGSILPHPMTGFGGGGEIVLPGVSPVDSIEHFHGKVMESAPQTTGLGNHDENVMRFDTEEAAKLAGLDMTIDGIVNGRGEVSALFVGDPVLEHREGVKLAKQVYGTEGIAGADIAVTNAYVKSSEAAISIMIAIRSIKLPGGTVVMNINAPEGQILHYLLRSFGKTYGGRTSVSRKGPTRRSQVLVLN